MKPFFTPPRKKSYNSKINSALRYLQLFTPFLFLFMFSSYSIKAQNYFQQEMQQEKAYYDSVGIAGDTAEGGGYAQYQKTLFEWAPRLLPDKDYEDYRQQMLNYSASYSPAQNSSFNPNKKWHLIGPDGKSEAFYNYTGQIHYIYFHNPENSNTVFACSPTGGLFKTTDGGTSWQNAGTDKGLPKSGTSSICIDNNGYWYITTGNGEGYRHHPLWQESIGIYRSIDQGATWQYIGLPGADAMRKVIEVNDNNNDSTHLLVTSTVGLFSSRDANAAQPHWTKLINAEFYDVRVKPDDPSIAFASGNNSTGVYKIDLSTGDTIKILDPDTIFYPDSIPANIVWRRRISLNIVPSAPDYLYAVLAGRDTATIMYRYKISTNTWVRRGKVGYSTELGGVSITGSGRLLGWTIKDSLYADSVLLIYGRDVGGLGLLKDTLTSVQNVESATDKLISVQKSGGVSPHADCHYLYINPVTNYIWQGNDGGLYRGKFINDSLIDWEIKNNGLAVGNINYIDVNSDGTFVTSGQFDNASNKYETTDDNNWYSYYLDGGDGYQTVINSKNDFYVSHQEGNIERIINDTSHFITGGSFPEEDFNCNATGDTVAYANFSTYYQTTYNYLYMTGRKEVRRYNLNTHSWASISSFSDPNIYPEMGCNRSGTWEIEVFNDSNIYVSTYGNPVTPGKTYFAVYKYLPQATGNRKWEWIGTPPAYANGWIGALHYNMNKPTKSLYVAKGHNIFNIQWDSINAQGLHNAVWNDITYNLDTTRVLSIIAIEQDYHGLYIATDGGVFYKPRYEQHWYDYTGDLPNVAVHDIKIANNRLYVGTYGRGVWYGSAPGCDGTGDTLFIKNDTTYNTPKSIYNTIFVGNGATLTVTSTLKMGVNAKIIVDRGAKLVVDGGTITRACPDLWPGVELRGNSNAGQDFVHQGAVVMSNGGTIEYAVTGIKTIASFMNPDSTFYDDVSYAGGIIYADNSNFHNNIKDVWFFPYPAHYDRFQPDNISHFKGCTFITDTLFYDYSGEMPVHVELDNVSGVSFESNLFENSTSLNFANYDERGIGISSWNAGFYAKSSSETNVGNRFNNLYYGIKTYAFKGNNKTIKIDGNTFNHNITGCYLGAETFASVVRNTFDIRRSDTQLPDGYCGLYLDASTGYQVEENEFYSGYTPIFPGTYSKSYGLVVNSSGPEDNMIYNNIFHNLSYATIAQNQNRSKGGQTGLQIKCNDYNNNYQDIAVTWDPNYPNSMNGIAYNQGSAADTVTAPAGNRFSRLGKTPYSDYNNNAESFIYHLPDMQAVLYNHRLNPIYYTIQTITKNYSQVNPWDSITGCPSNLIAHTKTEVVSTIENNKSSEMVYADSLDILTDNGNTNALNLDVATSMPPETMQLRSQLLNASPYLSDTVMVNAVEKENVLPNGIITEVLSANPQSAKSGKVLSKLDERNNPPDDNQMAQIHANDTVVGNKELIESKRAFYGNEKAKAVYNLVRFYMNDTTGLSINDSIASALDNLNTLEAKYQKTFCYFNTGDSLQVMNMLSAIPSEFELSTAQTDYHAYFQDYFGVLLALQSQNKTFSDIDSTQKATMYDVMDYTGGLLHAYARNLLIYTDGLEYHEPYILPDTTNNKSTNATIPGRYSIWDEANSFILYPNPAQEYVTLEYNLQYGINSPVVEIYSTTGVHINTFRLQNNQGVKIIDLRDYTSGTYIIRLTNNGKLLQVSKFVKL